MEVEGQEDPVYGHHSNHEVEHHEKVEGSPDIRAVKEGDVQGEVDTRSLHNAGL